ncbi:hypothetical protein [Aureimonas pseudogalii]|uniref:Uncharacterized protein n=1 Tax=Aureimonas pseudogalii TaxID=1744844 RepID=A0A7W6H7A9_9HYPH|nr:hypothetical protein [Aureimonas pseudogalii]MBB3999876.1 hypothetical protein [Aureimonas pseudogalii]
MKIDMPLDPTRFPLVYPEILDHIQQPDVLLQIGPSQRASLGCPTETASTSWSGFSMAMLEQLIPAAIEAGVTVIDARECEIDAYCSLVICGPMVAVGPSKAWRIDGARHCLSSLRIADDALLYAAIGALVHNMPALPDEPEAIAA